jgi:hypothetical protein
MQLQWEKLQWQNLYSLRGGDMARRLEWEKRRHDFRLKLSIADEDEYRSRDFASRWLLRRDQYIEQQRVKRRQRKRNFKRSLD